MPAQDGDDWKDLDARVDTEFIRRLEHLLFVPHSMWNGANPEDRRLAIRTLEAIFAVEEGVKALFQPVTGDHDKAIGQIHEFLKWWKRYAGPRSYTAGINDFLLSYACRAALPAVTAELRAEKNRVKRLRRPPWDDKAWQLKLAAQLYATIRSSFGFLADLAGVPIKAGRLAELRRVQPRTLAMKLLSDATGFSASRMDRAPRSRSLKKTQDF